MRVFFISCALLFTISACGPSAEQIEKQRIQDSIHAEEDRLRAIEDADAFITEIPADSTTAEQIKE